MTRRAGWMVVMIALVAAGCATRPAGPAPADLAARSAPRHADARAFSALIELAAAERRRPRRDLAALVDPPSALPRVGRSDGQQAAPPLSVVLAEARLATPLPWLDPPPNEAPARDDRRREAMRQYAAGRAALLGRDFDEAAARLDAAVRLDPASAAPRLALAEVLLTVGRVPRAVELLRGAAARSETPDPFTYDTLAREAMTRGEAVEALALYARLTRDDPTNVPQPWRQVVMLGIAQALSESGRHSSALEVTRALVRAPAPISATPILRDRLALLERRRGDLWRWRGDAACALGRFDEAIDAYREAIGRPAIEDVAIPPRLATALCAAGRFGEAAIELTSHVADPASSPYDEQTLEAIAILRLSPEAAGLFEETIATMQARGPSRARWLARCRAAALPDGRALDVLAAALERWPSDRGLAHDLVRRSSDVGVATRLVEASPLCAETLATAMASLEGTARPTLDGEGWAVALLRARMLLAEGRVGEARATLDDLRGAPRSAALAIDSAAIDAAIVAGNSAAARALARGLEARGDAASRRLLAGFTHRTLQTPRRALELVAPLVEIASDQRMDDALLAFEAAVAAEEPDAAGAMLAIARTIDPEDDRVDLAEAAFHAPGGPRPDAEAFASALRSAGEGGSRSLRLVRARRMIGEGADAAAIPLLRGLADAEPLDPEPVRALAQSWIARAERGDLAAATDGIRWLEDRHARFPHAPAIEAALARVRFAVGRREDAIESLRARLRTDPTAETAGTLEALLRLDPARRDDAASMTIARLSNAEPTPAEALELMQALALRGEFERATAVRDAAITAEVALSPGQVSFLQQAAAVTVMSAARDSRPEALAWAASLFDLAVERGGDLSPEQHQTRLEALVRLPGPPLDRLLDAADLAAEESADAERGHVLAALRLWQDLRRPGDAMALAKRAIERRGAELVRVRMLWLEVVAADGSVDDARTLVRTLAAHDLVVPTIAQFGGGLPEVGAEIDPGSNLAYIVSALARRNERADAEDFLELALEIDPNHPWACNDLGYGLADRGESLDRAEALVARALEQLPDNASVLDSMGWVRYKRGELLDVEEGGEVRAGAVTLLRRAAESAEGRASETILDHLGDALWLAGEAEEARRRWNQAAAVASDDLRALRRSGAAPRAALERATATLTRIRSKIAAADRGEDVPVAATPAARPRESTTDGAEPVGRGPGG